MKISQVLESQQQLDELNLAQAGQAVGGAVGKTANAVGAVAGGVKGAWDAAKAGFQSGKNFVGGQKVGSTDPKAVNQAGPAGTAPAQAVQGAAGTAMGNMGKALSGQKPAQAGQTLYATVKSQINNIDPQSKQKLLNLVQKSVQQKPTQKPGGAVSGAIGQMANALTGGGQQAPAQPNTMANAPVSATNTAKPGNPNAQQPATAPDSYAAQANVQNDPAASQAAADRFAANGLKNPAAPAPEQPSGKMDPNKAAELKGRLKAGQGVGQTAGGGFKNYVAGSQEKFQGADASGAPVFKKLAREGAYGFESKFFGGLI
jgi:hypothetical protein